MGRRLKILELSSSLSVGGGERLLLGLAERIDHKRFEIHICSLSVVSGNKLQPDFERIGVPVYVVGARYFFEPRAVLAVARYVRQHNIDIIHTHLLEANVVGRLVGKLTGRPVISTLQNEPRSYNSKRFVFRWLERLTARYLTTCLTTVSHHVRELFVREWGIPPERITTIFNAVPMEEFLAIPAGVPARAAGEGPVITNIGRLNPQKAQHNLLAAAKMVLQQRPDARFMIVGRGGLEQKLKAQAQQLGIEDQVIFTGLRRDIPNVLAQTDIFVLSSLWEGLPLTAVEAMAAARPVVLTDVGGNRELVESGVQGVIVPPDNVPALADALLKLLNNEQSRVAMGQAARARVQHDFSIDTVSAQYEALYESIGRKYRAMTAELGAPAKS